MKASGNGDVSRCANNLLSIIRGEIPYDRIRGIDARAIDKPENEAEMLIRQDATWLLGVYEPRGEVQSITIDRDESDMGSFGITATIQ